MCTELAVCACKFYNENYKDCVSGPMCTELAVSDERLLYILFTVRLLWYLSVSVLKLFVCCADRAPYLHCYLFDSFHLFLTLLSSVDPCWNGQTLWTTSIQLYVLKKKMLLSQSLH